MRIAFTWDDGANEDTKLFELHYKYSIPGMFFVPTRNSEGREVLSSSQISSVDHTLISFGGHTENHMYLTSINPSMIENEIRSNKEYLSDILKGKQEVKHFCYPGGKYNNAIQNIALKYYDTVRTADTMCFGMDGRVIKPSFHIYERGKKSLMGNALRNKSWKELLFMIQYPCKNYFEQLKKLIDFEAGRENSRVIIWGHSWEIEEYNLWNDVEVLIEYIVKNYRETVFSYDDVVGINEQLLD